MSTTGNHQYVASRPHALPIKEHNPTRSLTSLPAINELENDIDMEDATPAANSSTDDAEIPIPTQAESSARRRKAHSHVLQRLQALQLNTCNDLNNGLGNTSIQFPYTQDVSDIGTVNPEMWMQVRQGEHWVLDRAYLGEINAHAFKKDGILRKEFANRERPEAIPALYWEWLRGSNVEAAEWAEGWEGTEPTLVWIARWRDGELSKREWLGRGSVGFVNKNRVVVFEEEAEEC